MTIIITLSFAGNETGPFDLYSDATGFATPFAQNVSKAALLAGYQVEAPDGTTVVRLYSFQFLCAGEYVDIYSCATPNCDFAGTIICPVTTTTTTSSSSTTTTSTTYFPNPFDIPCLWSTNGGNSGLVAVYDFDTNTSTDVLVPNDFTTTIGINRPICATEDKLWLSDGLNYNDAPSGDNNPLFDYSLIREYDISTTSGVTLTYVREIRVDVGRAFGNSEGAIKTISVVVTPPVIIPIDPSYPPIPEYWPTSDFPYLLVGAQSPTKAEVAGWDISTTGDIRLGKQDILDWIPLLSLNQIQTTTGISATSLDLTGTFITTDNNVFIASRFNEPVSQGYNQLQELKGLPPFNRDTTAGWPFGGGASWITVNQEIGLLPIINLQDQGVPEFTTSWNDIKAMPSWGVDGLLQVLQPETNEVYTISQTPDYEATLTTTIPNDKVWLSSATGCANVGLLNPDDITGCTPTALPILVESNGANYIGPITFTYFGMSVIASSDVIGGFLADGPPYPFTTECGIGISAYTQVMNGNTGGASLENPAFSYTLEFPVPVNNIPLRTATLDVGDNFRFTTNAASTTLSITSGCEATVQNGNDLITDTSAGGGSGSVEVLVTGSEDFTTLTFVGTNQGFGGPWSLGCTVPPLNCRLVYSSNYGTSCNSASNAGRCLPGQTAFKKYFAWDVNTNTQQEILLPPSTATGSPNFALSENYIIVDVTSLVTGVKSLARYGYTDVNGIPSDTTFDGQFIDYPVGDVRNSGSIMEAVTDTKFLGTWQKSANQPFPTAVSQILEWELSGAELSYSVKIDVGVDHGYFVDGDLLLTFKTDGTPNKIIGVGFVPPLQPDYSNQEFLLQFDYTTNALDGVVNLPAGSSGGAALGIYDGGIYIAPASWNTVAPEFAGVWRFDLETLQWTQLDPADVPVEMYLPNVGPGDFASTPQCRVSDGITSFDPPPTTTTTTTTIFEGVNTIWTWFEAVTPTTTTTTVAPTTTTTSTSSTSTTTTSTTVAPTTTTTTTLPPLVGCLEFDYLTLVTASNWYTNPPQPIDVNYPSLLTQVAFNTGPTTNTTSYTDWSQVPNTNYDVVFNIGGVDYTAEYQVLNIGIGAVNVPYGKFSTSGGNLSSMYAFQFSKIDANGNDLSSILSTFDHTTGDGIKVTAYGDCTTPTTTTTTTATPEDIPCTDGLDVAFIVDYTQSMGSIVENVKAGIADIVNAISTESGAGGYRLSLITADENSNAFPNYLNCSDYINLPNVQKIINGPNPSMDPANTGDLDVYQFITTWELFGDNNEATFNQQLQKLNGGVDGTCIQLGAGLYASEPTDYAAKLVTESNFAGAFRANVAKHIVILTDQFPGSTRDYFDEVTWQGIQDMITYANANGIKYFVLGEGVDKVGGDQGSSPAVDGIYPWRELAEQTGGSWSNDASSQEIQQKIITGCNPTTTTTTTVTPV
jgi:hypothetical protein